MERTSWNIHHLCLFSVQQSAVSTLFCGLKFCAAKLVTFIISCSVFKNKFQQRNLGIGQQQNMFHPTVHNIFIQIVYTNKLISKCNCYESLINQLAHFLIKLKLIEFSVTNDFSITFRLTTMVYTHVHFNDI